MKRQYMGEVVSLHPPRCIIACLLGAKAQVFEKCGKRSLLLLLLHSAETFLREDRLILPAQLLQLNPIRVEFHHTVEVKYSFMRSLMMALCFL
jgi:hypothetical protein